MAIARIRCADRTRSREEVLARAARVAAGLAGLGVVPGDRVAVVLRNEIEFVEISLGISQAGATPVPVNWHWKGEELRFLLVDSGASAVFAHSDLAPLVRAVLDRLVPVIEVLPTDALRAAYRVGPVQPGEGDAEFEAWLSEQRDDHHGPARPPLGVVYSSGTTGRPKGILREAMDAEQTKVIGDRIFRAFGLSVELPTVVPAPMYHAAPNAHALFGVAAGCDVVIMPRFDAETFLADVETHAIAHAQVVPTMFVRMLRLPEKRRLAHDLSSLRCVVHAAAPCPPEVKRQMIAWWGPILQEYYGGTEVGTVVACDSAEWRTHPGTVGRAMDGCDVKIFSPDGFEAPTGTDGEIFVHPGEAWPGFRYIGEAASREPRVRNGYVSIGDGGHLDADGYLYLSDRIVDMVISGGVNIYPLEIEQCLISLDGVRDVAVFGVPDPVYGEALAAHVDTDPASDLDEAAIRAHVAVHLADYKVPRIVVLDRALPREDSGKLFKRRLRDRYRAEAAAGGDGPRGSA